MKDSLNKISVGLLAEKAACIFLQEKGLRLLKKNYRCYCGEIDLIMQDKDDIVFVEVRSRRCINYGTSAETINYHKRKKIINTAIYYLQRQNWLEKITSRFDVIAIQSVAGKMQIEWIKNAFLVEG